MAEFETSAQLELSVSSRSLRDVRSTVEDELSEAVDSALSSGGASAQLNQSVRTDGGMAMSGGASGHRSVPHLLSAQLEVLEEQLEHLDDLADGGGVMQAAAGGGEGGGMTILGGGGMASSLAGGAAALGSLGLGGTALGAGAWGTNEALSQARDDPRMRVASPGEAFSEDVARLEDAMSGSIGEDLNLSLQPPDMSELQLRPPDLDDIPDLGVPVAADLPQFEFDAPAWVEDPPTFGLPDRSELPRLQPPGQDDMPDIQLPDSLQQLEAQADVTIEWAQDIPRLFEQAVEDGLSNFDFQSIIDERIRRALRGR